MGTCFIKKSSIFLALSVQSRVSQPIQEVKHGFVGNGNILEALVVLAHRTALLFCVGQTLVDVGIGGMDLKLTVAAIVVEIGHEHVILEEIGDIA